ncbi:hypothetical protein A4H97_28320 [Niastella yeongjuensis]|uniref:Uncharacterized protein n=2 Tax=Niastella yeongjuensis TaxID=354355 RepID=A0A1V9EVA7_9BACT|nr:hypothetical protein A4H97_28320 [Niastella yeongjuensis]
MILLHTCAQETDVRRKANAFMKAHQAAWEDLSLQFFDTTMIKRFREHPFYIAYSRFLKDNGNEYLALRTARFRQYNPPPAALKAFAWRNPRGMEEIGENADLMSLAFLRSFDPGMPAQIVMNTMVPFITADNYLPIDDVMKYYRKRAAFGTLLYTEPVAGDVWQVWCADRSYVFHFTFDLRDGRLGKMQYAVVQPIEWPASVVKPLDEATGLWADGMRTLWDHYQSYDLEKETRYMTHRSEIAGIFYQQNQARFVAARTAQLKTFLKPRPALDSGFKETTQPGDNILQNVDTVFNACSFIYPEQWESAIEVAAGGYLNLPVKDRAMRLQHKGMFGIERYVQQAGDDQYEIWTVSDNDVVHYVWDLRTGRVNNVRYWIK